MTIPNMAVHPSIDNGTCSRIQRLSPCNSSKLQVPPHALQPWNQAATASDTPAGKMNKDFRRKNCAATQRSLENLRKIIEGWDMHCIFEAVCCALTTGLKAWRPNQARLTLILCEQRAYCQHCWRRTQEAEEFLAMEQKLAKGHCQQIGLEKLKPM